MDNRKGKIKVDKFFVESDPYQLLSVLSNFVPIQIERDAFSGNYTYYGHSKMFDETREGYPVPEYDATVKMVDGEIVFDCFTKL